MLASRGELPASNAILTTLSVGGHDFDTHRSDTRGLHKLWAFHSNPQQDCINLSPPPKVPAPTITEGHDDEMEDFEFSLPYVPRVSLSAVRPSSDTTVQGHPNPYHPEHLFQLMSFDDDADSKVRPRTPDNIGGDEEWTCITSDEDS